MTRVVVIAPYPPTADPRGEAALGVVRTRRAEGCDVVVVSPERSAARVCARPETLRGATRIASVVAGADAVVWFGADPRREPARAPWRRWTNRRLTRALDGVRDLRFVPPEGVYHRFVHGARRESPTLALRRLRAGAPTFVRTFDPRARRRRRVAESPSVPPRARDGQGPR